MNFGTKPIFIISLPRSGSTLLQRVLATHAEIATVAEPWLLLPLIYALRDEGILAEYGQWVGAPAMREFVGGLPSGRSEYDGAVRELALRMYRAVSDRDTEYFLDKTPRYYLIADEVLDIFPDAKCILLWRNPLAVVASMLETYGKDGRWNTFQFDIDLYKGIENLVDAARCRSNRFLQIRYEDLVSRPTSVLPSVFDYLDLEYDPGCLESYRDVRFEGSMGDPTGPHKFDRISAEYVDNWTSVLRNPLRKRWARKYLDWIGSDRLQLMGYDISELKQKLSGRTRFNPLELSSDAFFMSLGVLYAPLLLSGLRKQFRRIRSGNRSYAAD